MKIKRHFIKHINDFRKQGLETKVWPGNAAWIFGGVKTSVIKPSKNSVKIFWKT